ncbi:hypothetical protein [Kitasatospora sp. NPDC059571]|uniref:hypothetical protein n=1 Tax=Kitasatospora sp. NPDC059571 TaxID=3346871 RepID=UPI00369C9677
MSVPPQQFPPQQFPPPGPPAGFPPQAFPTQAGPPPVPRPFGQPPFPGAPQGPAGPPPWQAGPPAGGPDPAQRRRPLLRILLIGLGVVFALLGVLVVLVVRNVQKQHEYAANRPDPHAAWQKVADGMTAALAAKDEEAFLKPFKDAQLREKQRRTFRNLVRIPWDKAEWVVRAPAPTVTGELPVTFVHQVKGVDLLPLPEEYTWHVAGTGVTGTATASAAATGTGADDRVITDVAGDSSSNTALYPGPWDLYGELAVAVRGNLVVVADKAQGGEVARDADILDRAAQDDLAAWRKAGPATSGGRSAGRGFFVVLEKNRDVYNKLYAGDGRKNDRLEAGVNMPVVAYGARHEESGGSRIVMDTAQSRFTGKNWKDGVSEIGRHEMAHAIVEPFRTEVALVKDMASTQMWVVEGFADYMAFRGRDAAAAADTKAALHGYAAPVGLPPVADFYSDKARQRSANYTLSADAVRYLAATYGEDKALAFVAAHYTDPKNYQQEIATATGRSVEQFQAEWAADLRSRVPGLH